MEACTVKQAVQFTHLGNDELRNHHSVMVEIGKGSVARARVLDQHMIDRYLMRGLLTLAQHRAGDFLLQQASRAGLWPTGVNWSGSGGGTRNNYVPFGVFPFCNTLKLVEDRYGQHHAFVVKRVVVYDWDVAKREALLKCLREALNVISDCKLGRVRNPLRKLQRAADRKTTV